MTKTWLLAASMIAASHAHSMEFDDCYTWESRELATELSNHYRVSPLSGVCQSLPYTDQLVVRERRIEMLHMARVLHEKAELDGYVKFYEKVRISKDLMAIYGGRALLYIGAK